MHLIVLAKIKGIKLENVPLSFLFIDISELSNYVTPMYLSKKLPKPFQKKNGVRISCDTILKHLLHLLSAPLISPYLDDPY